MRTIISDPTLIAKCGLYCGACKAYLKERCGGCTENTKASWCKVRACCIEHGYKSCADCTEFTDVTQCKKFNNFMSKLFAIIFRSDRTACIAAIRTVGYESYAADMAGKKLQSIKRK